ncbi:hypothetical protein MGYG_03963 [Nannizzia gypsea CBS 118893]|uniref:Uncharacterized protein n=1 Tax=Arthroderma gypseum (strain ATCC MYA-4604 / CBS 118893) TaxID=535722 RepID=E4UUJ4_ARTGP|nr:hypothetical protein MGYG_03963 [Nannizzia gypsea CBS 118893]EFR00961.1 hypothetical protein MGYG_03963 [Nannizzia gypsea CBS 118893]
MECGRGRVRREACWFTVGNMVFERPLEGGKKPDVVVIVVVLGQQNDLSPLAMQQRYSRVTIVSSARASRQILSWRFAVERDEAEQEAEEREEEEGEEGEKKKKTKEEGKKAPGGANNRSRATNSTDDGCLDEEIGQGLACHLTDLFQAEINA